MSTALVEKTFLILETMAEINEPVPLRTLGDKTELPKSTLHRLLQSLISLGYVDQDGRSGYYYLTMQLAHLGRSNRYEALKETALPLMQQLHTRFNETVNLGVLEGSHVYYLHALETTQPLRWIVTPGARDNFYCTALGKAITAFSSQEQRERLIRTAHLAPRTPNTIVTKRRLQEALDEIRAEGLAVDDEENDLGVVCFAVPILQDGVPLAGISVSLPKVRLTDDVRRKLISGLHELQQKTQRLTVGTT